MRNRLQTPYVLLIPLAVYFAGLFLVALLVVKPPLLGWLGFGAAALVGLVLAGFVAFLFRRAGLNVERAPRVDDGVHRLLLLADSHPLPEVAHLVRSHLRGPGRVMVVSPVLASAMHFVADDEAREVEEARVRLDEMLATLASAEIPATGVVGTDDPLQAIGDALVSFPADEIVVVTSDEGHETWLEHGLRLKARDLFRVPVTCLRAGSPVAAA